MRSILKPYEDKINLDSIMTLFILTRIVRPLGSQANGQNSYGIVECHFPDSNKSGTINKLEKTRHDPNFKSA